MFGSHMPTNSHDFISLKVVAVIYDKDNRLISVNAKRSSRVLMNRCAIRLYIVFIHLTDVMKEGGDCNAIRIKL